MSNVFLQAVILFSGIPFFIVHRYLKQQTVFVKRAYEIRSIKLGL